MVFLLGEVKAAFPKGSSFAMQALSKAPLSGKGPEQMVLGTSSATSWGTDAICPGGGEGGEGA